MKAPRELTQLGLTQSEANVYYALVKLGPSSATSIMKKTGMYRANVYEALDKLTLKGLISDVFHDGRNEYLAAEPLNLYKILDEKKKDLDLIMPELRSEYDEKKQLYEIKHFKGPEGIKSALRGINEEKHYDAFGISSNLSKVVPTYFPHWIKERISKKLTARMIKAKGDYLATRQIFGDKIYKKLFEVKEIPPQYFSNTATFIMKAKVVIILESIENPLAIIIYNKEIRDGFFNQFESMWDHATPEKLK